MGSTTSVRSRPVASSCCAAGNTASSFSQALRAAVPPTGRFRCPKSSAAMSARTSSGWNWIGRTLKVSRTA
ncbi:MAG: hypothetical protein A6D92_01450 [Symbiobacterium thermophilum]|uniref:Uncharacterized protein n=1 Tax=Symbiobacterium thermophilum TaxID=2734 RepID=A0A1Y2T744_SYMTR|nr:MAG: hypothetical protein A6D92_01450 [Symbiobacterium thermophilum]